MKSIYFYFLFLFFGANLLAQEERDESEWLKNNEPDSLYREDQFYIGISFNFLSDLPEDVNQSGFSGGLNFGFIRDIPLNEQRNIAIGVGLGLNLNTYGQNLKISEVDGNYQYQPLTDESEYTINRFNMNIVEVPIEFRWRTSTLEKNAFWRVYLGMNLGYTFRFKSTFEAPDESIELTKPDELERFRTSLKLTFGYGVINFFVDYSLNPVFDANILNSNQSLGINPIKAGLTFYIL
ncbi:porin family protein [Psychroflexus aestuariivivens]|uniref:porin family protein n=1 Tax=Psychroflexus aestuariivivens TaxID=1795040 RepID=UPI000FDB5066|nr:porin family protein [Psychroflexus aestuariivivens]